MTNIWRIIASTSVSLFLLTVAASAADGSAAEPEYSATYKTCMEKADGGTYQMGECNTAEIARQEKALNDIYKKIMAEWTGDDYKNKRDGLQKAERAWVAFRSAQCDFDAMVEEGGTLERILNQQCYLDMTYKRVKELQSDLEDGLY